MKPRKLKPLHKILEENPGYWFDSDGNLWSGDIRLIGYQYFEDFGKYCDEFRDYPDSFYEEPEKKKLFAFEHRGGCVSYYTTDYHDGNSDYARRPEYDLEFEK